MYTSIYYREAEKRANNNYSTHRKILLIAATITLTVLAIPWGLIFFLQGYQGFHITNFVGDYNNAILLSYLFWFEVLLVLYSLPITVGFSRITYNIACNESVALRDLAYGYWNGSLLVSIVTIVIKYVVQTALFILLIVPGILYTLDTIFYSFVLVDRKTITTKITKKSSSILKQSRKMAHGYRSDYLILLIKNAWIETFVVLVLTITLLVFWSSPTFNIIVSILLYIAVIFLYARIKILTANLYLFILEKHPILIEKHKKSAIELIYESNQNQTTL